MKILSISTLFPYPGLSHHGVFVKNRLEAIAEKQMITVISPVPDSFFHRFFEKYQPQRQSPYFEKHGRLLVYRPRFLSFPGLFKEFEMQTCLHSIKSVIEKHNIDFDVIDVHWGYPDLISAIELKKMTGKPVVFTLRGMETFYKGDFRQEKIEQCLSEVDAIVSLSQEMIDHVRNVGYRGPISLVPNGVDSSLFYYTSKESARETLGLPTAGKFIIGVGSLIKRKGFDFIIKALKQLPAELDVKFFIIGKPGHEGDYENELRSMVRKLGLSKHVVFVGPVRNSELRLWYNAADVFCLSSRGEGSPNVLLEALSSGCPSIYHTVGDSENSAKLSKCSEGIPFSQLSTDLDLIRSWSVSLLSLLTREVSNTEREEQASRYASRDWNWCANQTLKVLSGVL